MAVASLIAVAFMGSVIVTPLYSLFQRKFGFSEITLTLVYAVYVVGNVVALVLFGQISDQAGRKTVALPALAMAAGSALLFLFAQGTLWLFAGRLMIGLAVGILSGTGTAWLGEQYGSSRRSVATTTAATANLCGVAIGPLVGGLLAQYAPAPLQLPFISYIFVLAVVAVAVARTPETRRQRVHTVHELHITRRLGVPRDLVRSFATPAITGLVLFAVGGLYFALIPSILIHDLHEHNVAVGGLVVFELALVAATVIVLGRNLRPSSAMTCGLVFLLPTVALVVAAQALHSMPLLLTATACAGIDLALGYRGSLEVINAIAPADRRAEVVSTYFLACFVGNSIPVIGVGVLSTLTDPLIASTAFASTIGAVALAALAWNRRFNAALR